MIAMPVANDVTALCFDVFGTVVDWRATLLEAIDGLAGAHGLAVDGPAFVDDWKAGYRPAMDAVNDGRRPWTNVDVIYRERLEEIALRHGLDGLPPAALEELVMAWTRSRPWPDAVPGVARLSRRFTTATLSNGNFLWLTLIAKTGGLAFDAILTAENARLYKPRPEVYRMATDMLGPDPARVMLVACHNYDLAAAQQHGMRTAFLPRQEFGPGQTADQAPEGDWDVVATDLEDLAAKLGC